MHMGPQPFKWPESGLVAFVACVLGSRLFAQCDHDGWCGAHLPMGTWHRAKQAAQTSQLLLASSESLQADEPSTAVETTALRSPPHARKLLELSSRA
eukprot:scaffold151148_cov18-Tisochrysis_lutea.AAC.1